MTEPKITTNRRIVVVGASSTAIACLEGLVFTPYLNLTSLTLVSPDGMPAPQGTAGIANTDNDGETGIRPSLGDSVLGGKHAASESASTEVSLEAALQETSQSNGGIGALNSGSAEQSSDCVSLSPQDEDAPDADRMARMGLERHVRIVR